MIQVSALVADYGDFWLKEIDLSIAEGECFVLAGPSGAGKTLLLETIMGVKPPRSGEIRLAGTDISRTPPEQREFSYLPQDLALFPHLTVWQNIAFGLEVRKTAGDEIDERIREVAGLLRIEALLGRSDIRGLSGGEKQRVALARALVVRPRVIFLDEPFNALDAATRTEMHGEVRRLQQRLGVTILLVTHDHEEAFAVADHMAVIMEGKIEQVGTPTELYNDPANLRVARFLLIENILEGRCLNGDLNANTCSCCVDDVELTIPRSRELAPEMGVAVGIRACHVKLTGDFSATAESATENLLRGTVQGVRARMAKRLLTIRVEPQGILLQCEQPDDEDRKSPSVGDRVFIQLPVERLKVFCSDLPTMT